MPILNIESPPDYINKFIHLNMEQLCNIYDEGKYNNPDTDIGVMVFQCSEKDNKMDVQYMNSEMLKESFDEEIIKNITNNKRPNKKIFFIFDLDLGCSFLMQL